ncbi:hypothetical protein C8R44DRAFT_825258 [Mycena epipterygia]|nr:hypothetical protein C8R44DRAFT_825258 [Mycena epipterygia]
MLKLYRPLTRESTWNLEIQKNPNDPDVILIFWITAAGHRILVHVTDYLPYTFHPISSDFEGQDIGRLIDRLNAKLGGGAIHGIDVIQSTMHPSGRPIKVLKITATGARALQKTRDDYHFRFR